MNIRGRSASHPFGVRAAAVSLALAMLALPGPSPVAQEGTFEGTADVVEVQVPVNVVSRDGAPVRGLTAEDFEIFDRGRKQDVSDFEVVDLASIPEESLRAPASMEAAIPAAARRHFLLLFDLTFASPASVIKARRAASDFVLQSLHPADLVAVATFSLDVGPRLLVTFTPDRAQLARAIDTLGAPRLLEQSGAVDPLHFMIEDPERTLQSSGFSDVDSQGRGGAFAGVDAEVQAYLQVIANEMERLDKSYQRGIVSSWVASLQDMASALASVEGRKHVIFFSEGFDGRLMLGRGADAWDRDAEDDRVQLQLGQYWMVDSDDIYGNTALQAQTFDMLEAFRRSDCVIQAVDISGLGSPNEEHRRAHTVGQDALFYMANETGGGLYENTNDLGGELESVLERSSVTYVLTFHPFELENDGSYHRLEIKLRRDVGRGSSVSYRAGYFAPRPYEELHPLEKSLIAADAIAAAAPRHELDIDVLAAPFRATEARAYVPVIIELAGEKLLAGQKSDALSTELYAYVSDEHGQMRDFFTHRVTLNLTDEGRDQMRRTGLKYYGHLSLEPGEYLVRVLARNAETGRTGVESVHVSVPNFEQAEPRLLPPFFVEPSGRWFLVREQQTTTQETVVYPFTVNGSPYVPAAKPNLEPGEDSDVVLVAYNLLAGDVEVSGTVITSEGREIDVGQLLVVERTITGIGGLDKLRARFRVTDLAGGTYTLKVALKQPGAELAQVNSIPFSVSN
jgi:VWFA-related protein